MSDPKPTTEQVKMIEEFHCPGCVCGSNLKCGAFKFRTEIAPYAWFRCDAQAPGTRVFLGGLSHLGMPKGFNKVGPREDGESTNVRLALDAPPTNTAWDKLNVAVWAMVKDGFLFVRTFVPRRNFGMIDVIRDGKLSDVPGAIDVGQFVDDID